MLFKKIIAVYSEYRGPALLIFDAGGGGASTIVSTRLKWLLFSST
jgi:hypothetical protein